MKKLVLVVMSLLFVGVVAGSVLAAPESVTGRFEARNGDAVYVCGCGAGCTCGTLAKVEGTCGCGKKLVKTTVARVDKGRVYYLLNGKELSAPQQGKYACGCGKGCKCGTVSQNSGTCGCGKEMVKIKI